MSFLNTLTQSRNSFATAYHLYLLDSSKRHQKEIAIFVDSDKNEGFKFNIVAENFKAYPFKYSNSSQIFFNIISQELRGREDNFIYVTGEAVSNNLNSFPKNVIFKKEFIESREDTIKNIINYYAKEKVSESDWEVINKRRGELLNKKFIDKYLSNDENKELEILQSVASSYINKKYPLPINELDEIIKSYEQMK